ncbi:MAG: thioredoxin [Rickettsiales bacterium]|jgi:thioredoxin 1|nr:thioredoxin [Rickettsiales bacterium]
MALQELASADFEDKVLKNSRPVFIDFWAPWCGPCRQYLPIVSDVAGEMDGVDFFKVNVEEAADLARRFGISSIPTSMVFKDGKALLRHSGAMPKKSLVELIKETIA